VSNGDSGSLSLQAATEPVNNCYFSSKFVHRTHNLAVVAEYAFGVRDSEVLLHVAHNIYTHWAVSIAEEDTRADRESYPGEKHKEPPPMQSAVEDARD
jgi:hypothetical protein